jgi:hypothetical protein
LAEPIETPLVRGFYKLNQRRSPDQPASTASRNTLNGSEPRLSALV